MQTNEVLVSLTVPSENAQPALAGDDTESAARALTIRGLLFDPVDVWRATLRWMVYGPAEDR